MYNLQKYNADQRTAYWTDAISRCRSSGMPVRTWCEQEGISSKTYYYWQKKIYRTVIAEGTAEFVEVTPHHTSLSRTVAAEISVNGITASVYAGADAATLQNILSAMKSC